MELGLYIHLPFCVKRCNYCDFNSYVWEVGLAADYVEALIKEVEVRASADIRIKTVYVGGGTPTLLGVRELEQVVGSCFEGFGIDNDIEVSIEANPGTVDLGKLGRLKGMGINRLSLGVQAFDDGLLKRLGRIHTVEQARDGFYQARAAGFDNINIDLIFGLPGQSLWQWVDSLEEAINLHPEHISLYSLTIEPGTKFYEDREAGLLNLPDEDVEARMYELAINFLKGNGYEHYEISNFALPGRRCEHNQIYWRNEEYLGLGAGAHSYVGGRRFWNVSKPGDYIEVVKNGGNLVGGCEELSVDIQMAETIILGLRLLEGVELERFRERFGVDLAVVYGDRVRSLVDLGLISYGDGHIRLTDRGLFLANRVFMEFL